VIALSNSVKPAGRWDYARDRYVILRFGFFAFVVGMIGDSLLGFPLILHTSAWYTNSALIVVGVVLTLATYAFHTSLGGQKVFSGKLLEE
jgi:hypothetical protein